MLEPGEGEGGPGPACELWVPGELARRFPRPPDQSAVFAEALLAGVTPRQDTRLDRAALRAGIELLAGGKALRIGGRRVEVEAANLRNVEHWKPAFQRSHAGGERGGRGGVLERISPQTCSRTKGAGFEASSA